MFAIITDARDRIVRVNCELLDHVGVGESEILGQPVDRFLTPDETPAGTPGTVQRAQLRDCHGRETPVSLEITELVSDGPEQQVLILKRLPVQALGLETLPGWQCLNNIESAVLTEDRNGFITFANARLLALLGFESDELVGKHWTDIVPKDSRPSVARQLQTRPHGTRSQYDTFVLTRSGRRIPVIVSARPVFDHDRYQGTVSDFTDITERRRIEDELRRLSEVKSEFVAAVSHDLRTPLTTIMEGIRLTHDGALGPVNDEQRQFLLLAWEDALRLSEMINDLLDLAKIERGRLEPLPSRFDPARQVTQAQASYRGSIRDQGLKLTLELPAKPLFAWCDPNHYRRILVNLLSNAIKFTRRNGQVVVKVEPTPEGSILTSVRDTGIGIPRDQQHRIFGRFEQVRRPETAGVSGTGLGLSLCRQLVELNGGRIWFKSAENRGSTFHFTVPSERPGGVDDRSFETA